MDYPSHQQNLNMQPLDVILDREFAVVQFKTLAVADLRLSFFIKKNQNLNAYYLFGKIPVVLLN